MKIKCECKHLSTMTDSKDCRCNDCGEIWRIEGGKWFIVDELNETGGKS